MNSDEANLIIDNALQKLGTISNESEQYFQSARFGDVKWLPTYVRRLNGQIWAIELYRGDRIPEATVREMERVKQIEPQVQLAFFVPEGEYEHLVAICREGGIALIAKITDEYEALVFAGPAAGITLPPARFPEWVITDIQSISNLQPPFPDKLAKFGRKYVHLGRSGTLSDAKQEDLVKEAIVSLLKLEARLASDYTPVELLRVFEQNPHLEGRDHYFHTFNNFLLGCLVIDRCYSSFEQFRKDCSLTRTGFSIEYVWFLTVLFHDVGYPIEKYQETSEMIYGVPTITKEQAISERKVAWESPPYITSRAQLISLYDYLAQDTIDSAWSADPYPMQKTHPLDVAFEKSFLGQGHGVASCMRMLADFYKSATTTKSERQYLVRHVFLAGLSIPFHDWRVRKSLTEEGITRIKTSRFPFASLLMFVDSIQEDRRERVQNPDILKGIKVNTHTITPQIDLNLLSPEKLADKKQEAQTVKDFLEEDLLRFQYPEGLVETKSN